MLNAILFSSTLLLLGPSDQQANIQPVSIHQQHYQEMGDAPTHPDLLRQTDQPSQLRGATSAPCSTVFGYLPYWESSANIRYDLITHLACFSVEVNADGSLGNDHGWPWTGVINEAHANGVKVILVATLFNGSAIDTLISSPTNRANFFANIKAKMLEGNADGLNIDFESGTTWQDEINEFMAELTAYLHAEIPGSEVTIAGPAVNWSNRWDLGGLAASCDGIFIMGYAFAGSWSSTTGANAPLTGGSINITDTVLDEYADALATAPEKLILGLPYYGHEWVTSSSVAGATVNSFVGSTRFRDDQLDAQTFGRLWHTTSQTPWYRWQDGPNWRQIWYDDAESLGLKFDLAINNGLQGIGMWALNYDGARPELWNEIEARFACAPTCCDMNCDGSVDVANDLPLFVDAIMNPTGYTAPAGCSIESADTNGDAIYDGRDVLGFVAALVE